MFSSSKNRELTSVADELAAMDLWEIVDLWFGKWTRMIFMISSPVSVIAGLLVGFDPCVTPFVRGSKPFINTALTKKMQMYKRVSSNCPEPADVDLANTCFFVER